MNKSRESDGAELDFEVFARVKPGNPVATESLVSFRVHGRLAVSPTAVASMEINRRHTGRVILLWDQASCCAALAIADPDNDKAWSFREVNGWRELACKAFFVSAEIVLKSSIRMAARGDSSGRLIFDLPPRVA